MTPQLERAIKAYREGLKEADRLAKDQVAPYGPPLRFQVGSAYTHALAEVLHKCWHGSDAVDAEALASLVRGLDVSGDTELFRGGPEIYLAGLISKLWIPEPRSGQLGILAGPAGGECAEWLSRVFGNAGYPRDTIDSAWLFVLEQAILTVNKTIDGQGPIAKAAAAQMIGGLVDAMPEATRERIIDEGIRASLADIGIALVPAVSIVHVRDDGEVYQAEVALDEYERSLGQAIADALRGRVASAPQGLPVSHYVSVSAPTSLVVEYASLPREAAEEGAQRPDPQSARLWAHYLGSSDVTLREMAWQAGRRTLEAADDRPILGHLADPGTRIAAWERLRQDLLADDDDRWAEAAKQCVSVLAGSPSILLRSLADAAPYGPDAAEAVLSLLTPKAAEEWIGVREDDLLSVEALSESAKPRAEPPLHPPDRTIHEACRRLASPFADALCSREWLRKAVENATDDDRRVLLGPLLRLAETTSCASLLANIAALIVSVDGFRRLIVADGLLRDRLARTIAEGLMPLPADPSEDDVSSSGTTRDLRLEYSTAAWLWYSWTYRSRAEGSYERLAFLAVRGAALLVSLASRWQVQNQSAGQDPCVALKRIAENPQFQVMAWHSEPEGHDFRLHPLRGWTFPWASAMLLDQLAEHHEFFARVIADALIGERLFELARTFYTAEAFSLTARTRTTWLEHHLPDPSSRAAVALLRESRGHIIDGWPQPRREALDRIAAGPTAHDVERDVIQSISTPDPGLAVLLLHIGLVMGPLGWCSWLARLRRAAAAPETVDAIVREPELLWRFLLAVSIAAVIATERGAELPAELSQILLPPGDIPDDRAVAHAQAVAAALSAGARLESAGQWLESLLRGVASDHDVARRCVRILLAAEQSPKAQASTKAQIHEALQPISALAPYDQIPELRRYRSVGIGG